MSKSLGFFAAGAFALLATLDGAQAKMVYYEINGQRYSYSTNNRQHAAEARRRIAAANAADAARTKAEAERASNPLARVLGSPVQREAAEAQARLKQVMAGSPATAPAPASEEPKAAANERKRVAGEAAPRKEAIPAFVPRAEPEHPRKPDRVAARPQRSEPARTAEKPAAPQRAKVAAVPKKPVKEARSPAVQSVHFDADTGIKTTVMTDGTVQEEPFEQSAATVSKATGPKPAPEDTTSGVQKPGKAEPKN